MGQDYSVQQINHHHEFFFYLLKKNKKFFEKNSKYIVSQYIENIYFCMILNQNDNLKYA